MKRLYFAMLVLGFVITSSFVARESAAATTWKTGYVCNVFVYTNQTYVHLYSQPSCGGSFVVGARLVRSGAPGSSAALEFSDARLNALTDQIINNRWNFGGMWVDSSNSIATIYQFTSQP